MPTLEEVFKKSGTPTFTFVAPKEYARLCVALRTPGRGVILEGPSGIGKSTAVKSALAKIGLQDVAQVLEARNPDHRDLIALVPETAEPGLVVIDDFHRLDERLKLALAEQAKLLADKEDPRNKLVLVGINKSGATLVSISSDVTDRIERIRFGVNEDAQIRDLIKKGEEALNVIFSHPDALVEEAMGSFNIAQVLCHEGCLTLGITESSLAIVRVHCSVELLRERVLDGFHDTFWPVVRDFGQGHRVRREGRAPYLQLLHQLSKQDEWVLDVDQLLAEQPDLRLSVGQVIEKGYLTQLLKEKKDLSKFIHFDSKTNQLATEDPKFFYFLKQLPWSKLPRKLGFISMTMPRGRDFALSFSGKDRLIAKALSSALEARETAVFYDENEQHRILASDVEDYLAPIYRSEARYVVPIISSSYPGRIWTKFESRQFEHRFGEHAILPVVLKGTELGMFDAVAKHGYLELDPSAELQSEAERIADILCKRLSEDRVAESATSDGGSA